MLFNKVAPLLVITLGLISQAYAQNPVLQSGSVTKGHAAKWSAQGTIQDAGPAGGGNANVGITDLPILGTGTPLCIYDAPKSGNAAGYHSLCLGANLGDKGTIAYNFGGSTSPLPFQFCVNGTCYDFPFIGSGSGNVLGTSPSTMNGLACFGNTTGTLIKDCDASSTITSTGTVGTLTATAAVNAAQYQLNGKVFAAGSDPFTIFDPDGGNAITIYGASGANVTYYTADTHTFQNNSGTQTASLNSAGLLSTVGGFSTTNNIVGGYIQSLGNVDVAGYVAASGQVTGSFVGSTGDMSATGSITAVQYKLRGQPFATMPLGAEHIQIFDPLGANITMYGPSAINYYDNNSHLFRNRGRTTSFLQADGTGVFTATGTVGMISDDAVKENIIPYTAGLSALLQLNPVSFTYAAAQASAKASANPFINTDKQYGLLASNVEPVLPEMVKSHIFFQGKDALKSVFPGHFSFVTINAIKEVNTQVLANTAAMGNFNTSIETLNSQVQAHSTSINNLNTSLDALYLKVQANETSINTLNTSVATNTTSIAALFSQDQGFNTRITALETPKIGKGIHHFNAVTAATTFGTAAISDIAGSNEMILMITGSGAASITLPTAAQIIAAVPGWQIGGTYRFRLANPTSGTLTLVPGTGVTITGLPTTASNKWREWIVSYTAANAVNFRDIGSGTD